MPSQKACDFVLEPRWIAPVVPAGRTLEHHAIAVCQGRIVDVGPTQEMRERWLPDERIERPHHLVIPGLVNAHTPAATTLFRGLADDLRPDASQERRLRPLELRFASAEMVRDGTRLAIAEMLAGGTTCFADTYLFPDACANAAAETGIRCVAGLPWSDRATAWARESTEYLQKAVAIHDEWRDDPLVSVRFVLESVNECSDKSLRQLRSLADELDLKVHTPLLETRQQQATSLRQFGQAPLWRLRDSGLLNASLSLAHAVQLDQEDHRALATAGTGVVHCPQANAKLAAGIAPVRTLLDAGIAVGLGTDGAASNNDLDLISEMQTASLVARLREADPLALTAHECLQMATLGSARCLGLEREIGSIEVGKYADLVAIGFSAPACWPVHDPVSQLVFAAARGDVADTWVGGQRRFGSGGYTRLDLNAVHSRTEEWRQRIC